ncbi:MAG: carboxypeptidase-like regulatory domain-containing protein, partial [Bacteroidetes bacterium]|nr:carboxypeptidase-like regulatory domain-containing protein [Bacteroidota bacterium]
MINLKSVIAGIILTSLFGVVSGQTSTIKGRVYNSINNEAVPFANIFIDRTSVGATSDLEGNYIISNLKPGTYSVVCSFIGFKRQISFEVPVNSVRTTTLDFALVEESTTLNQVVITASPFNKREESPVSLRTISSSEIY